MTKLKLILILLLCITYATLPSRVLGEQDIDDWDSSIDVLGGDYDLAYFNAEGMY